MKCLRLRILKSILDHILEGGQKLEAVLCSGEVKGRSLGTTRPRWETSSPLVCCCSQQRTVMIPSLYQLRHADDLLE